MFPTAYFAVAYFAPRYFERPAKAAGGSDIVPGAVPVWYRLGKRRWEERDRTTRAKRQERAETAAEQQWALRQEREREAALLLALGVI
ncbi:MAG: hypothetical protein ACRESF_01930 [Pseudomonas sp.]